jgi:hypothetical protein
VKLAFAPVCHRPCRIDHLEGSPKTATPFGAFIFTGGAPELAGIDA